MAKSTKKIPTTENLIAWMLWTRLDEGSFNTPQEIEEWLKNATTECISNPQAIHKSLHMDYTEFKDEFVHPDDV